jgi:hypothetical protein
MGMGTRRCQGVEEHFLITDFEARKVGTCVYSNLMQQNTIGDLVAYENEECDIGIFIYIYLYINDEHHEEGDYKHLACFHSP